MTTKYEYRQVSGQAHGWYTNTTGSWDGWVLVAAVRLNDKAGLAACVRHHCGIAGAEFAAAVYRKTTVYSVEVRS